MYQVSNKKASQPTENGYFILALEFENWRIDRDFYTIGWWYIYDYEWKKRKGNNSSPKL